MPDFVENDQQPTNAPLAIPESVKDLIGEGKKYETVEAALKALGHAQQHVAQLEAENKAFRETGQQTDAMKAVLDEIGELKKRLGTSEQTDQSATPDPETQKKLVRDIIHEEKSVEQRRANFGTVLDRLVNEHGDKAKVNEFMEKRAVSLGISVDDLQLLAQKSPDAFFKLVNEQKSDSASGFTPPADTHDKSGTSGGNHLDPNTWPYFKKLMREDYKTYQSKANQARLHQLVKEANARGEDFFNPNS